MCHVPDCHVVLLTILIPLSTEKNCFSIAEWRTSRLIGYSLANIIRKTDLMPFSILYMTALGTEKDYFNREDLPYVSAWFSKLWEKAEKHVEMVVNATATVLRPWFIHIWPPVPIAPCVLLHTVTPYRCLQLSLPILTARQEDMSFGVRYWKVV